jgi:hypothetical protein
MPQGFGKNPKPALDQAIARLSRSIDRQDKSALAAAIRSVSAKFGKKNCMAALDRISQQDEWLLRYGSELRDERTEED